jgi:transposase
LEISKDELSRLYVDEKLSQKEIAQRFKINSHTVRTKLKRSGIPIRSRHGVKIGGVPRKFNGTKEELENFYYNEGLTTIQIAQHYNMGRRTLERWLHYFGIKIRGRSERVSGDRNPFKGRKHTEAAKFMLSQKHKGITWKDNVDRVEHHRINVINRWANPEYRERNLAALRRAWAQKPTKPERVFKKICEELNLPLRYVGNGAFSINGFNPDFIDSQGRHIAVEIFGDYWHDPEQRKDIPSYMIEANRKAIFQKYGWDLIVIWEHELSSLDDTIKKLGEKYEEIEVEI